MDCRQPQKLALESLLESGSYPTAVAVHGPGGTGKSTTLKQFLSQRSSASASWVQCNQCATARVLLQRALRQIFEHTGAGTAEEAVCENVDIFLSLVRQKFVSAQFTAQHILVLDRIDELPDYRSMSDLLSCLTRIPELTGGLRNLVVVFVYSTVDPRALVANPAVPRVWFPRFTLAEAKQILVDSAPEICVDPEYAHAFKSEFMELVVNALGPSTGTNVAMLKRMAKKIWPAFIEHAQPGDSVAKLYMRKSHLFQADHLADRLTNAASASSNSSLAISNADALDINETAIFLLCAAYLASYNSPRYDMRYFSLAKTMRNKRRETRPKKSITIPSRSLAPPAFEMERLLSIFHAINPAAFDFQPSVEVGCEIATLTAQNLITKTANDPLDSRTKWKINVPWSFVQRLAHSIGFNIEDYLVEG